METSIWCKALNPTDHCLGTVVLIHGFMGDHRDWGGLSQLLVSHSYKVLLVDLPGHGKTPFQPSSTLSMLLDSIWTFIDREREGVLSILGYSLGGRVSLGLKSMRPDDVDHLIIESSSFGLKDEEERELRRTRDMDLLSEVIHGERTFSNFLRAWYRLPLFSSLSQHSSYPQMLARRESQSPKDLQDSLSILGVAEMPDFNSVASSWTGGLLYIAGELDRRYCSIANNLSASWNVRVIEGVSHNVHLQDFGSFASCVLEQLKADA